MKPSLDTRRTWLVVAVFGGLIAFTLGVGYLKGLGPSEAEACSTQCKKRYMEGHMVYVFPAPMTPGVRGRGPEECKCFPPGTYNPTTQ
jgi:hypothetical protein